MMKQITAVLAAALAMACSDSDGMFDPPQTDALAGDRGGPDPASGAAQPRHEGGLAHFLHGVGFVVEFLVLVAALFRAKASEWGKDDAFGAGGLGALLAARGGGRGGVVDALCFFGDGHDGALLVFTLDESGSL